MEWFEAIIQVFTDEKGRSMHYKEITSMIFTRGYWPGAWSEEYERRVNRVLTTNADRFKTLDGGYYELINSSIVASSCTSYSRGDSEYKSVSDFVDSTVLSNLKEEEKNLLELIVNFRIPLTVNREVCFADILDKLKIEILDEEKICPQSVDAAILQEKLMKLRELLENEGQNQDETLLLYINKLQQLLNQAVDGKVQLPYAILGEFVPDKSNPKVVIYLKSIENSIRGDESRWQVMAGVFIHEMFHAWNYFNAGQRSKSALAIDEPMVEFETLYFLKKLETFTESQSNPLHKNVSSVRVNREFRVKKKQQSIGDVAAYGFGYYLYEKLSERDVDSITWIETYSKKSASIKSSQAVKNVEKALIPIYPFKSEKQVMRWFERIIFDAIATSKTAGKSATDKVDLDVMLRKLVLACIEMIGRKCFDAQELYAFAPIFKVCLPECKDIEKALKLQLDELVKEGFLEALPHDCYSMKLAGVEVKHKNPTPTTPATLVPAPTKSKGGRKKATSIPFVVEFPDDKVIFDEETAVSTYIESLKHIGFSRVQSLGKMHGEYALVSNVEDPYNSGNSLQHYVDGKYSPIINCKKDNGYSDLSCGCGKGRKDSSSQVRRS